MTTSIHISEAQRLEWIRQIEAEECRRSFAWFFRRGWSVLEGGELEWNWHLQALCDTAQAFAEGWMVASGRGTQAMVDRQDRYWMAHGRERLPGELLVQNIVINGGPGTLKSRIWMVFLQPWIWLFDPTYTFAATSGTNKNVGRDSSYAKELVSSAWYRDTFRPPWRVGVTKSGQIVDSTEKWVNSAGGERLSIPLLSSWSGIHADGIGIDDPDDAQKVWGDAARLEVRQKIDRAIFNRVRSQRRSHRFVVQQHVHADDETSNLKVRGAPAQDREALTRARCRGAWSIDHRTRWAALVLPVEFNPAKRCTTPWGWSDPRTELGEIIFAAQWTPEVIAAERERLGSAGWSAQGNQDPEDLGGGKVKRAWWSFFTVEGDRPPHRDRPDGCRPRDGDGAAPAVVLPGPASGYGLDWLSVSVDAKMGSLDENSSNCGLLVVGGRGRQRFVFDDQSRVLDFLESLAAIRSLIRRWGPRRILIEAKAQGEAIMTVLRKELAEGRLLGPGGVPITVVIVPVEGGSASFESRFQAMIPDIEAGLVHLYDGAPWLDDLVDEVCAVPNGRKDDRADALSQLLNYYQRGGEEPSQDFGVLTAADFGREVGTRSEGRARWP